REDDMAVFGVGVVAEIGALVDEALAARVDHDAERVGMLLEIVADREVAEFRRVAVPADGVAARPVAVGHGADIERHADAVAGVEAGAAHLGEVPARAEIARAPFGIGLEAAGSEHRRFGMDIDVPAVLAHARAADARAVEEELVRPSVVEDAYLLALAGRGQVVDEAGPAARHLGGEPAPELELAVDLEGLATIGGVELDPLPIHPDHGLEAVVDQRLDHVGMGAV